MKKILLALSGIFAVIVTALVLVRPASPSPIPAPQQNKGQSDKNDDDNNPVITWSVPTVSETLFPGTSKTVTVQFRSNQNLSNVVVALSSTENEFDGNDRNATGSIFSVIPSGFPSIVANQTYQITVTLNAPSAFIKRIFRGTIHLRNATGPPKTCAPPLSLDLQTDWNTVFPDNLFTMSMPLGWQMSEAPSSGTHTFIILLPDDTTVGWIFAYTLPQWAAAKNGDETPIMLLQAGGLVYAYADSQALSPDQSSIRIEFTHALASFAAR